MIIVKAKADNAAEILIYDVIGEDFWGEGVSGKGVKKQLDDLGEISDISVRINSPGGNVWDGLTIYNLLKEHPAEVHVHIDGIAASAASFIAMSGDLISMGEGSMMMVHNPWSLAIGEANDLRKAADMLDKVGSQLVDIYTRRTGNKRDAVVDWMDAETWFTDSEAVENGFADERTADKKAEKTEDEDPSDRWQEMIARFKRPPSSLIDGFKIAAVATTPSAPVDKTEIDTMTTKTESTDKVDIENARKQGADEAIKAEGVRQTEIRNAFSLFPAQNDLRDECLKDMKCTVEVAREKLLVALATPASELPRDPGHVEPGVDARDKFVTGATLALSIRAGLEKRDTGNEFQGQTLCQIGAAALERSGISARGLTQDGIARRVLASHTTSDFPQLLSNVAGKMLREAYGNFPNTYQQIAHIGSVSDFKVHPRIQMGSFNNLATIPEGGEYSYGTITEDYENAQAETKGKAIQLTRQMMVNDDLGGFTRRSMLLGRSAARSVNSDLYAYITSGSGNHGPTTSDTGQFFNDTAQTTAGGHGNLTDTGTAMTVASISLGRKQMRQQKDKGLKETLNILPKVLLVPVGKEDLAWAVINSTTDVSQSNSAKKNYVQEVARLDLVSDPYLDDVSATAWYLFADPQDAAAAFEVVFLDGVSEPFLDDMIDFDTDSMKFKVRLDYGIANGDWRGAYMNDGA